MISRYPLFSCRSGYAHLSSATTGNRSEFPCHNWQLLYNLTYLIQHHIHSDLYSPRRDYLPPRYRFAINEKKEYSLMFGKKTYGGCERSQWLCLKAPTVSWGKSLRVHSNICASKIFYEIYFQIWNQKGSSCTILYSFN